ncbi:enoyl-CoA hydratase-related protein [Geomicrobium sediminis]|uniref:Enoyl-CoA hydratase/carnithine racemase n=1 Tax=Geomicrobium sediminis TaxID=1347788 RepID=A0ABS2PGM5_9BACL|nr:enoyl-CoA hydratase/carnithine racemase [Geomicrobium sediminis]
MTNITVEIDEYGICYVQLNRKEQANSLSKALLDELKSEIESIKFNEEVKVVVFTAAGNKIFSAGADLKERSSMTEKEVVAAVHYIQSVVHLVSTIPQPTIAAVNGSALGGGLELALATDIRVGAIEGTYGLPETSLAIIPGAGGTQRLAKLIGPGKAKQLIFSAARISGQEAFDIGIFEECVPLQDVVQTAKELALTIANNGPLATKMAKQAIDLGLLNDLETGLAIERASYEKTIPTADRKEGLLAFKEKRTPSYIGK